MRAPYPGLRSFTRDESDLFFGRESNIDSIVDRLAATRLVAVLGASGSGKSSLVRTGVIDALTQGLLVEAGGAWRIADFHPGDDPITNLARELLAAMAGEPPQANVEALSAFLRRGPRSIVEWCRDGNLPPRTNLLLLADQFEELFRYDSYATREQAQAFVNLLIESARQRDVPIYVVITMRSEYLGACSLLDGLAEAINNGQYLTPRMTREQCKAAIAKPAALCDVTIEPALVNRLLNDLAAFAPWEEEKEAADAPGRSPGPVQRFATGVSQLDRLARRADQLPLMQHVLNRLWMAAVERGGDLVLTLSDYETAGRLRGALSSHADQVLGDLVKKNGPAIRQTAERVFRGLVSGNSVADTVRRPTTLGELITLGEDDEAGVRAVVEAFRAPDCNFLTPGISRPLTPATPIDISHESLIRQWSTLSGWVAKEAAAGAWWRRRVDDANRAGFQLRGPALASALQEVEEYEPTEAWAARHGGSYDLVKEFLKTSRDVEEREARREREEAERKRQIEVDRQEMADQMAQRERDTRTARTHARRATIITVTVIIALFGIAVMWWKADRKNDEADAALAAARIDSAKAKSELEAARVESAKAALELRAARIESARAGLELGAARIESLQSIGEWQAAGAVIAGLVAPLLQERAGMPLLPEPVENALERVLQFQWLFSKQEEGSAKLGGDRKFKRVATYGNKKREVALVAALQTAPRENVVEIFSLQQDRWQFTEIELARLASDGRATRFSGMSFYEQGSRLALFFADEIILGTPSGLAAGQIERRLPLRAAAPAGDTTSLVPSAPSTQTSPEGLRLAQDISAIMACSIEGTSFIVLDGRGMVRVSISENEARFARAVDELIWAYSVDETQGVYAWVGTQRKAHVEMGWCEGNRPNETVPVQPGGSISDIEINQPGLLAVADTDGQILFLQRTPSGTWQQEPPHRLNEGETFLRFADNRQVWIQKGPGNRFAELRTIHQGEGKDEGVAVMPPAPRLTRMGDTAWIVALANENLSIHTTLPAPPKPSQIAAIMAITATSDSRPRHADETRRTIERLRVAGHPVGSMAEPGNREKIECARALEQLTGIIEQLSRGDYEVEHNSAKKFAERLLTTCNPSTDSRGEAAFLALLTRELATGMWADGILSRKNAASRRSQIIHQASVLSVQGSPYALRTMAAALAYNGHERAALGLQLLALEASGVLPYTLVDRPVDDATLRRIITGAPSRRTSADGRDQELLATADQRDQNWIDALYHATLAHRQFVADGEFNRARKVAADRSAIRRKMKDEDVLTVWRRVRDARLESRPVASPVITDISAISMVAAAEQIAARMPDTLARAQFLLFAGQEAKANPNDALRLLMDAVDNVYRLGDADRVQAVPLLTAAFDTMLGFDDHRQVVAVAAARALVIIDRTWPSLDADVSREASEANFAAVPVFIEAILGNKGGATDATLDPAVAEQLQALTWQFVRVPWGTPVDSNKIRQLMATSASLQRVLLERGNVSRDFRAGRAWTLFWSSALSRGDDKQDLAIQSVRAFQAVIQEGDFNTDLQFGYAEVLRLLGYILRVTSKSDIEYRVNALQTSATYYQRLLDNTEALPETSYLRVAALSGLSHALTGAAHFSVELAVTEQQAGNDDAMALAALAGLRAADRQRQIFESGSYAAIRNAPINGPGKRNMLHMETGGAREDAFVVGFLAGTKYLAKPQRAATACERVMSHPGDPRRRAPGRLRYYTDDTPEMMRTCKEEIAELGANASRHYLVGRLHALEGRRAAAVDSFVAAINIGYAFAYSDLAADRSITTCKIGLALRDRYRYLVLRDHLKAALELLDPVITPTDRPMIERLMEGANKEPTSTQILGPSGDIDVAWLKRECNWRQ